MGSGLCLLEERLVLRAMFTGSASLRPPIQVTLQTRQEAATLPQPPQASSQHWETGKQTLEAVIQD